MAVRIATENLGIADGLSVPKRPKSFGENYLFPENLSQLSSLDVSDLMGRLSAWRGYVTYLLGRAIVRKRVLEDQLNMERIREIRARDGTGTMSYIRDTVSTLPDIAYINGHVSDIDNRVTIYTHLRDIYQGHKEYE